MMIIDAVDGVVGYVDYGLWYEWDSYMLCYYIDSYNYIMQLILIYLIVELISYVTTVAVVDVVDDDYDDDHLLLEYYYHDDFHYCQQPIYCIW